MWKHEGQTISDLEMLESLQSISVGTLLMLDGPSGCGKTRLLKQLAQNGKRQIDIYPVDEFKELIMRRFSRSVKLPAVLFGSDIVAIEDIDYLGAAKSIQYEAAFIIEHTLERHAVILTGIQLLSRLPSMAISFRMHDLNLAVWEYQDDESLSIQ